MQESPLRSLGRECPLEEGMATLSSILALKILWIEETGGLQSIGLQRVGHDWVTFTFHNKGGCGGGGGGGDYLIFKTKTFCVNTPDYLFEHNFSCMWPELYSADPVPTWGSGGTKFSLVSSQKPFTFTVCCGRDHSARSALSHHSTSFILGVCLSRFSLGYGGKI